MTTTRRNSARNAKSQNGSSGNEATTRREERGRDQKVDAGTASLWARYRRTRSRPTRDQLVERYRGIVDGMAQSMVARLPRSVDVQDLAHAGMWGLMRAIQTYEPERGCHFLPFMRIRVRGAMLDELRNLDYLPRLARHRRRALDAAEKRLRDTLERAPSDAELAEELGITESNLRRSFAPAIRVPAAKSYQDLRGGLHDSGDRISGREGVILDELADEHLESPFEALNRQDLLAKIKASLQPIEWRVLELHYLVGLSGKDVARELRLSASRVCQIHGRVLSRLKQRLGAQ